MKQVECMKLSKSASLLLATSVHACFLGSRWGSSTSSKFDQNMQLKVVEDKRATWWPAMLSVIAAVHSSLTVGYAYGYTSTALEQLSELPDGYAFRLGSISADLLSVRKFC